VSDFSKYFLKENPFPETAVIDPLSDDIRVNGGIFHEGIFRKEIESLRQKTEQGVNVVYLSGIQFDRGIGKSALLINHMSFLKGRPGTTSAYVRCGEKNKPRDIARKVVEQWHCRGYLWEAFKAAFIEFSKAKGDPLLAPDAVEELLRVHAEMPERLPLNLYTHIRDKEKLAKAFAGWAANRIKVDTALLNPLLENYLSTPADLLESMKGTKPDSIEFYGACSKLLTAFGFNRHFVFLDQFEDMVMGTSKSGIGVFSLAMKNLIRLSSGSTNIFVTLHPNSEQNLRTPAAQDLTGVAPLDAVHRIDVMVLDTRGDSAISLAEEYFRHFRTGAPPYPTFPVEAELLEFICYMNRGKIRDFLQQLHHCLDYGAGNGWPEFTFEYAKGNPLNVLGREIGERDIEGFRKHRGKVAPGSGGGRSLSGLVKEFKKGGKP